MEYTEVELDFIIGIPQLVTNISISDSQWTHGKVSINEKQIWLVEDEKWETIPLEAIELVNRKLPKSVENKIMSSSHHSHYMLVDYKRLSLFGTGYVTSSMIFTGDRYNIEIVKKELLHNLGFSGDVDYQKLNPEQVRLLLILYHGITDMGVLLPFFNNDRRHLNGSFSALKKRNLVDEFAHLTSTGFTYVESLKEDDNGKIGKDLGVSFKQLSKTWDKTTSFKAKDDMNKVVWKSDTSSIMGHVDTNHLWKFLPLGQLKSINIIGSDKGQSSIMIDTEHDVSITLESTEKSVTFALFDILDRNQETIIRIIEAIFMGVKSKMDLAYFCGIEPFVISSKIEYMLQSGLIEDDLTLTPKAIKIIKKNIKKKIEETSLIDSSLIDFEDSKRLREYEMDYAKKKMIDKLF